MPTKKSTAKKTAKPKAKVKKVAKKAIKKVAKKTAAKKAPTKKTLVLATDNTSFWVSDGQILNSLLALRDSLDLMSKEVYQYHCGGKDNDFANWVEVVLCDGDCAHDLRKAKTPRSAKTVVVKHLKRYTI